MFHRFGTHVTLLERSAELLAQGYEPEVGRTLKQLLQPVSYDFALISESYYTKALVQCDGNVFAALWYSPGCKIIVL